MRLYEHPSPPQFPTLEYEVVVRVEVSTVSETDAKIRLGEYWGEGTTSHPLNLPVVPGTSFCGKLVQLDQRNSAKSMGWKLGDSVISLVRVGANSRHLCIGYDRLVKVPSNVDLSAAVCLPEAYMAAFQALHIDHARSKRYSSVSLRDKSILILGGSTKVGRALIELSVAAGSGTVYATSKSEKRFSIIEEAGGIPLDKDPHHWYSLLVGKMDVVVCVDCEDMKMSELKYEHIQTLKRNGKIVLLNGPEYQGEKVVDLSRVDEHSKGTSRRLYHYNVFEAWESDIKLGKRDLEHLLELLSRRSIKPKIFERIPLTKVARAQEVVLQKALPGFIVCEPWLSLDADNHPNAPKQRPTTS
jgi:NADPH:quinone reductase-like Zn-dependent oxidoreductase